MLPGSRYFIGNVRKKVDPPPGVISIPDMALTSNYVSFQFLEKIKLPLSKENSFQ